MTTWEHFIKTQPQGAYMTARAIRERLEAMNIAIDFMCVRADASMRERLEGAVKESAEMLISLQEK